VLIIKAIIPITTAKITGCFTPCYPHTNIVIQTLIAIINPLPRYETNDVTKSAAENLPPCLIIK